jgi:chemotaxis protein methyltransferase CheR
MFSENSFKEFRAIICRNVLIYFCKDLQDKIFNLFNESLETSGFLFPGQADTQKYAAVAANFKEFEARENTPTKIA